MDASRKGMLLATPMGSLSVEDDGPREGEEEGVGLAEHTTPPRVISGRNGE